MTIQVEVLWVVTPCSDVAGYGRFTGSQPGRPRVKREDNHPPRYNTRKYH